MTEKHEFAHALSGKPEAVKNKSGKIIQGYIIRDMSITWNNITSDFLYVTGTTFHLSKWRSIEAETELFWVLVEKINPLVETKYVVYKNKEIAEEHLQEIK
jgi:hypothetical protein